MAISPSPTSAYQVRPATEHDIPQIVSIGRHVFTESFAHTMTPDDLVAYLNEFYTPGAISSDLSDLDITVLVASTPSNQSHTGESRIAGYAYLRRGAVEPSVVDYPKPIELWRLYIDSTLQRSGVGKLLMEESLRLANVEGCQTMWLGVYEENFKAQRFYKRLGFRRVGEHDFWTGSTVTTDFIVVKSLV